MAVSKHGIERPITCILVDDHAAVLDALYELLTAEGFEIVGRARTGAEALELRGLDSAILVTDLDLPDLTGFEVARELMLANPSLQTVLYAGELTRVGAATALRLGIRGIMLKDALAVELPAAIRIVAAGGTYIDPRLGR